MRFRQFHLLLAVVFNICAPALRGFEPSTDELAVYRAIFAGERLVVLRSLAQREDLDPEFLKEFARHHDETVAKNRKRFPTAEASTIESFFTRRELVGLLKPKADIGVPCVVLDNATADKLYPDRRLARYPKLLASGWAAFKWRYPRATAVSYISRVGFNTTATQALVFLQQTTGPTLDDEPRHVILLDLRNGAWTITQKEKD
jgi:hypothetical protein